MSNFHASQQWVDIWHAAYRVVTNDPHMNGLDVPEILLQQIEALNRSIRVLGEVGTSQYMATRITKLLTDLYPYVGKGLYWPHVGIFSCPPCKEGVAIYRYWLWYGVLPDTNAVMFKYNLSIETLKEMVGWSEKFCLDKKFLEEIRKWLFEQSEAHYDLQAV